MEFRLCGKFDLRERKQDIAALVERLLGEHYSYSDDLDDRRAIKKETIPKTGSESFRS